MRPPVFFSLLIAVLLLMNSYSYGQKMNGEIFIPMNDRSEIWLKPKLDSLDNRKEYEFRIRVAKEFKVSQFLFEKGLAIQTDSVLKIIPNSSKNGGTDTATLRVIVNSITGSRIFLFQKAFIIRVPDKMYPVINNPKLNVVKVNDRTILDRNRPYPKTLFINDHAFISCYDNEASGKKMDVKNVTVAMYEKEGKQYVSGSDTLSYDAKQEIKKIKNPVPVFIKVEAQSGKLKKVVWSRVIIYAE